MLGKIKFIVAVMAAIFVVQLIPGCTKGETKSTNKKVIIIGFDGMDPVVLQKLIDEDRMPNFKKLASEGTFKPLQTSMPPQSPVAWSDFITGMNPGGHGIFDFIHRDPNTMIPYLSTSNAEESDKKITIGNWVIPLAAGKVELLRHGKSFWEILQEKGIPCAIYMIPANFPPVECEARTLSGMGTPDILGTYGTYSYYSDIEPEMKDGELSGGRYYEVNVINGRVDAKLVGPKNTFKKDAPDAIVNFTVFVDAENPVGKIVLPETEILLKQGEWSEWVRLDFDLIPYLQGVSGICRFYLKEVHPNLKLYVTPININPEEPALPISTPSGFSREIYDNIGYFYTQGMPEDTKALSAGIFTDGDFLTQAELAFEGEYDGYKYMLSQFKEGLLFFYFSSTDQQSHMFWRQHDSGHPAFNDDSFKKYGDVIEKLYQKMDVVLGEALDMVDDKTTIFVMSDHGFAPFNRSFNLNTWLLDNGYVTLIDPSKQGEDELFMNVDWRGTRAYGLGLNGLYINLEDREPEGIVTQEEREKLMDELAVKLENITDPDTGLKVIKKAYKREDIYSGPYVGNAPDIIVGFARGYRISWESSLGKFPKELIADNLDPWSGDHCMAFDEVPGVILTNKKINMEKPALYDMAPTLMAEFGFDKNSNMVGNSIF